MVEDNARTVALNGLSLTIFIVSLVCLCLSLLSVGLRTYIRVFDNVFGLDDGLILAGIIIYTVDVALACYGTTVGLGTRDADLNMWLSVEGKKYLMLWMMVYVIGLAAIKSSICVTLFRVAAANNAFKIAIYVLLGLTITTFVVTIGGILLLCTPVSANWDGQGQCAGMRSMVALSYTSTASTILTDLSLAILPGIMVMGTPMKLLQKLSVVGLLSFGSVASLTTMARAPFIQHYWTPLDNLNYWTGYIVLLSNCESAIGLIASSIPSINKFIYRKTTLAHKPPQGIKPDRKSLVTFGSAPVRPKGSGKRFMNPTDQGTSFASVHARDWARLQDQESDTSRDEVGGIRAEYTYQVELSKINTK
ncbi:hypothetical protein DHEL01_v209642 [Diaporthe helianthi]|uniref:Rhodopsin domain-containing protein n=1 Tax=Diaporthe helianthi TaxID=158607 RepID=A0A2P5HNX1_DIAHE|nr:hypothetical protein DHEL01_v209642 [Diaporthe helianthi]